MSFRFSPTPRNNNFASLLCNVFFLSFSSFTLCANTLSIDVSNAITMVTPLQVNTQILHPSCYGQFGLLTILAQGGTPPYQYQANGNYITPSSNLYAATYTITVSDALSNSIQTTISIINPPPLNFQTCVLAPACQACLTPVSITPAGGTPPYTLYVNAQQGTSPFLLSTGNYTLMVEDANACSASSTIKINNPTSKGSITSIKQTFGLPFDTSNNLINNELIYTSTSSTTPSCLVYPNPCNNFLTIQTIALNDSLTSFDIIDLNGRIMLSQHPSNLTPIDIQHWPPGGYLARFYQNNQVSLQCKLVKLSHE